MTFLKKASTLFMSKEQLHAYYKQQIMEEEVRALAKQEHSERYD